MAHYIVTCVDVALPDGGAAYSALNLVADREKKKAWPFYNRTPHLHRIGANDLCVIYASSKVRKFRGFLGWFCVEGVSPWSGRQGSFDKERLCNPEPALVARYEAIHRFVNAASIEKAVPILDLFSKNKSMWWVFLQGGCRALTASDFLRIKSLGDQVDLLSKDTL